MRLRIFLLLSFVSASFAAPPYEQSDWISYRDGRYIHGCDLGRDWVYFASTGGILRYNLWKAQWDYPLTTALIPGEALPLTTVYVVAFDDDRRYLWGGTTEGLVMLKTQMEEWEFFELPAGNVTIFSIGFAGEDIWLEGGTPGQAWRTLFKGSRSSGGFITASLSELQAAGPVDWSGERAFLPEQFPPYYVDNPGLSFFADGKISDNFFQEYRVTCQAVDEIRRITYLGFWGYGVGIVDQSSQRIELNRSGPGGSRVNFILPEDGSYYLAGSSFTIWRKDRGKWEQYYAAENTAFASDTCYDLVKVDRKVYIAGREGLSVFEESNGRFYTLNRFNGLSDNYITALDKSGDEIWIGAARGISVMSLPGETIKKIEDSEIKTRRVHDLRIDGNYVWAGTDYGIYLHDRKIGDWTYVAGSEILAHSPVRDIKLNKKEVWFAKDAGIDYFDKTTGKFTGLSNVFYHSRPALCLLPGDSLVWIGTDEGLVKYDRSLDRWVVYEAEDGLPPGQINCLSMEGDYLWIGGDRGLTRFYWNDPYRLD